MIDYLRMFATFVVVTIEDSKVLKNDTTNNKKAPCACTMLSPTTIVGLAWF